MKRSMKSYISGIYKNTIYSIFYVQYMSEYNSSDSMMPIMFRNNTWAYNNNQTRERPRPLR